MADQTREEFIQNPALAVANAASGLNRDGSPFAGLTVAGIASVLTKLTSLQSGNSNLIGIKTAVEAILSQLSSDDNDVLRVSLYGKNVEAGDMPINVTDNGSLRIADGNGNALIFMPPGQHGDGEAFDDYDTVSGIAVASLPFLYNGADCDRQRTPKIFKPFNNPEDFIVWTPASGKRIRLMGYRVAEFSGATSVAEIHHTDATGGNLLLLEMTPATSPNMGNGILLPVDAPLLILPNVDGQFVGYVFGTEE